MARERGADRLDQQGVELGSGEVLEHQLVEGAQRVLAERLVLVELEVRVRELPVALELLPVREVRVRDLEVRARPLVDPRGPPGDAAERRPAHERADRPREVVVQRGHGDVGRRVRVVDRVRLRPAHDRLARVELPAEEGVHEPRDRHDLSSEPGREEVVTHLVALVHRPVRLEAHDHRLRADRERAGEHIEPLRRGLQVHETFARLVVARLQLRRRADPRHADPLAAVERLQVGRVADGRAHLRERERLVVARGRGEEARVVRRLLVRDQPRLGHLQAQPHHRAVGRVLLHRLERERVVQEVRVVHQRDLLQPFTRDVVPPAEPVDDQRVSRLRPQVERLDRDPLGAQHVLLAAVADRAQPLDEALERRRPVVLGAEQESDQVLHARSSRSGSRASSWRLHMGQSCPPLVSCNSTS